MLSPAVISLEGTNLDGSQGNEEARESGHDVSPTTVDSSDHSPSPASTAVDPLATSDLPSLPTTSVEETSPALPSLPDPTSSSLDPTSPPPPPPPSVSFQRRPLRPTPKGILKSPTPAPSRFSFRRDILQPFNTRYGAPGSSTGGIVGGSVEVLRNVGSVPGAAAGAAAAVGGFWGSALKKVMVATNAAAGVGSVRDGEELHEGGLERTGSRDGSREGSSSSGPAPYTPTRGHTTSSLVSNSPYATVRSSASAAVPVVTGVPVPALSVTDLKKVRFRMATLKVIYPINGPDGPLAPWEEGRTKQR
jgi:protein phosphatase 1 regulatory subunit 37